MPPEIEEFAKTLAEHVRDAAIQECDMLLRPDGQSPVAKRWRAAAKSGRPEVLAKEAIPDIVDQTLFYLLHAIDEGFLRLAYTAKNGRAVSLNDENLDGLAGWWGGGAQGWITKYSNERFVDDLSDLDDLFKS